MLYFKNAKVILPDRIADTVVAVRDSKIAGLTDRFDKADGDTVVDCGGNYLSPGFVDLHVHGGGGYNAMSGRAEDVVKMCACQARHGTTSIVPTTLAAPVKKLREAMSAVSQAKKTCTDCDILGIFLEGPFLSQSKRGAQSASDLLVPDKENIHELLDFNDDILMMGAAPEIEGGLELGREIAKRGVIASVAHSDADYSVAEEALAYGYSDVTHLYNACSGAGKKDGVRTAGVVEAALANRGYTVQFIADLHHLPVGLLKLIYAVKGPDQAYAVSDGLESAGIEMKQGEVYTQENGVKTVFDNGVMKVADMSCLAGSCATMSVLMKNLWLTAGIPLYDAVRMTSATPARVAGFGAVKGRIAAGYDADLVVFDSGAKVQSVYKGGKKLD